MMPIYGAWVPLNIPKVDVPNSVTFLDRMPSLFEWYVVWYGSKNRFRKTLCFKEIELYAKNEKDDYVI